MYGKYYLRYMYLLVLNIFSYVTNAFYINTNTEILSTYTTIYVLNNKKKSNS